MVSIATAAVSVSESAAHDQTEVDAAHGSIAKSVVVKDDGMNISVDVGKANLSTSVDPDFSHSSNTTEMETLLREMGDINVSNTGPSEEEIVKSVSEDSTMSTINQSNEDPMKNKKRRKKRKHRRVRRKKKVDTC